MLLPMAGPMVDRKPSRHSSVRPSLQCDSYRIRGRPPRRDCHAAHIWAGSGPKTMLSTIPRRFSEISIPIKSLELACLQWLVILRRFQRDLYSDNLPVLQHFRQVTSIPLNYRSPKCTRPVTAFSSLWPSTCRPPCQASSQSLRSPQIFGRESSDNLIRIRYLERHTRLDGLESWTRIFGRRIECG